MADIFTRDILNEVYEALVNDERFNTLVPTKNVWTTFIPEGEREQSPVVRINQIDWRPSDYSSDQQIQYQCEFQIDVWMKQEDGSPFIIGQMIQQIMAENLLQQTTPAFDYDPDTEMLRDGRRYAGYINF